ncbi:MAG: transglycosylase SLT domain-containing protein [Alphaproteobacteria bacterium]
MARMTLAVLVMCSAAPAAHAVATDSLIEGAKLCTKYISRYERQYGIPTHLLAAISTTESGRYHKGLKISIPWPWTINVEGKGYYFDTKQEAIAAVKQHRARGAKSIDVGCMQVNLVHHAGAFASLDKAFEPEHNVQYAASFLRNLYQDGKSWKKAAADYHSKTPSRGGKYVGNVYNSWYQIIEKLRLAKGQSPAATGTVTVAKAQQVPVTTTKTAKLPDPAKKVAEYKAPRMKVIEISKKNAKVVSSKENGVKVVRPKITVVDKPKYLTLAKAETVQTVARPVATETPRMRDQSATSKKSGPTFIFSN